MSTKNFIVAIELGSTKIRGIAGKKNPDGTISVLALSEEDATQCIRKGVVYNIDKTTQAISNIIQRLRAQLKTGIKQVFVGIGGQSIHSHHNLLFCDMPGTEGGIVSQQLIVEMMDENRATEYSDKEVLDVHVQEYRADNLMQSDPVGIPCTRLEGNFLNILQNKRHYQNLLKCFANADVKIADIYLAPTALADVVLTPTEKRSGCMLVDLGADTTTVVVYYKNIVRHVAVIPLGGNSITKDLCALQLEEQDAEKVKTKYASAFTPENEVDGDEQYNLSPTISVPAVKVIDLVEARVDEIITNAWNQVPGEFAEKLLGGIVLTGGGAQLNRYALQKIVMRLSRRNQSYQPLSLKTLSLASLSRVTRTVGPMLQHQGLTQTCSRLLLLLLQKRERHQSRRLLSLVSKPSTMLALILKSSRRKTLRKKKRRKRLLPLRKIV